MERKKQMSFEHLLCNRGCSPGSPGLIQKSDNSQEYDVTRVIPHGRIWSLVFRLCTCINNNAFHWQNTFSRFQRAFILSHLKYPCTHVKTRIPLLFLDVTLAKRQACTTRYVWPPVQSVFTLTFSNQFCELILPSIF